MLRSVVMDLFFPYLEIRDVFSSRDVHEPKRDNSIVLEFENSTLAITLLHKGSAKSVCLTGTASSYFHLSCK